MSFVWFGPLQHDSGLLAAKENQMRGVCSRVNGAKPVEEPLTLSNLRKICIVSQHKLDRLKKYDKEAIAKYYGSRPWIAIWRTIQIIASFTGLLLGCQWDIITNQIEKNK